MDKILHQYHVIAEVLLATIIFWASFLVGSLKLPRYECFRLNAKYQIEVFQ